MKCPKIGQEVEIGKCCMTDGILVVGNNGSSLTLYMMPADPEDPVQYVTVDSEDNGRRLLALLQDWFEN